MCQNDRVELLCTKGRVEFSSKKVREFMT